MDDVLIWCYRRLGPIARRLGIQKVARRTYEVIAERLYPPGTLITARQNGRTWRLRRDVAERGEIYEPETVEWIRRVVRPGTTVIDVGANVGQMTLEMAALVGPRGRVIAVEPSVGNLEYLRHHLRSNELEDRTTVVEAACAEQDGGEVSFFIASTDGESSVGTGHNIIGADPITKHSNQISGVLEVRVPRTSVDALSRRFETRPSAIKIDVEGAELMVLEGARETLRSARPHVRVAFHPFAFDAPHEASRKLLALAEEHGYRIEGIQPGETLQLAEYNMVPL